MSRRHPSAVFSLTEDDTPTEKLETAAEHKDRAERLIQEAKDEAESAVKGSLPFDADVESVHLEATDSVRVTAIPDDPAETLSKIEDNAFISQPLGVTFGQHDLDDRERIRGLKEIISEIEQNYDEGAPIEKVLLHAQSLGMEKSKAEHEVEKLRQKGDVYEPKTDHLRTV